MTSNSGFPNPVTLNVHVKSTSISFPSSGWYHLFPGIQSQHPGWPTAEEESDHMCTGADIKHDTKLVLFLFCEQCQYHTKQMLLTALTLQIEMFPLHQSFWSFTSACLSLISQLWYYILDYLFENHSCLCNEKQQYFVNRKWKQFQCHNETKSNSCD